MTALHLLLWIVLGIALQLLLFLSIAFWHHWQAYAALKSGEGSETVSAIANDNIGSTALTAAWVGYRSFTVVRRVIEDGAHTICSFYLQPADGQALAAFFPGQFLTFKLDVPGNTGTEQIIRCYSLSDAPGADAYRVSIKRVPAPAGSELPPGRSSNFFHDHVQVGTTLQVRAPSGHFYLDAGMAPVVLIGSGIGITPMLSMINWSLAAQPGREIWLFYGARNAQEMVMKAHLETLAKTHANFHLRLCFSESTLQDREGSVHCRSGRVDVHRLRNELPLRPYHFYLCGPSPMMESLVPALEDWGVAESHIHFEAFGPASIKRRNVATKPAESVTTEQNIRVNFAKSGREVRWTATSASLLDFAEANGITVNSGCRAGGCGSCQTTITSGQVRYGQAPDFDPEPGTCLLCTCVPSTSLTLDA